MYRNFVYEVLLVGVFVEEITKLRRIYAGFRPGSRGPFVSAKGPKAMLAVPWPFGCSARFTDTGGVQTRGACPESCRRAQTLLAFSPGAGCTARPCHKAKDSSRKKRTQHKGFALRDEPSDTRSSRHIMHSSNPVSHFCIVLTSAYRGRPNSQGSDKACLFL
jgi:hypothetical protein